MRALHHIVIALAIPTALSAQALSPVAGSLGQLGPTAGADALILGTTTLTGVREVYARRKAMELLVNAKVPHELDPAPRWNLNGATLEPHYRVDGVAGYYTLYFDSGERLILAVDDQPRDRMTRAQFQSRFPGAREARQVGKARVLEVQLQPCVTLSAFFDGASDTLAQAGYGYTCGAIHPASR